MTTPAPAPVPAPTKTKTYRGNCHCGAYVYDVELAADLEGGNGGKNASECNCTVCYKKGAIWGMPAAPRFLRGDPDALSTYSFGRRMYEHKVFDSVFALGFYASTFCSRVCVCMG